jgi:hypothetical protein
MNLGFADYFKSITSTSIWKLLTMGRAGGYFKK